MTTIQLGSITIQGFATSGYVFTKMVDWYTLTESKTPIRERPIGADGAFGIDRDWRESAAISIEGSYLGTDEVDAAQARLTLTAALRGVGVSMSVTDALGTTTRAVSVRKATLPDDIEGTEWDFTIDMIAPDPNRYGTTLAPFTGLPVAGSGFVWPAVWPADWGSGGDPGRVSATNSGTATTYPILEVVGGLAGGVELVEVTTGSYLRLERDIPATSTIYFNTRTGRAYENIPANDISGFLTRRDWGGFAIPAGATRTIQFNALSTTSGTPRLTVRFAPAF